MQEQIRQCLQQFQPDYLGVDLVSAKAVKAIDVNGQQVSIDITLGFPFQHTKAQWQTQLAHYLESHFPQLTIAVCMSASIEPKVLFSQVAPHPQIKNIIAVASGKGGVGKSTTSVNLACALQQEGARVGLLDADIYGPSQPQMLGANTKAMVYDNKRFDPVICHGLQTMSLGYLVDNNTPMVWRGPMVSGALQQLFFDTNWSELDYLVIDLPPGTGDVQLTLSKKIPVTAAVIVTTPQDVALLDARKAVEMFKKVSVPVFGLIENMALHTCRQCGHQEAIFGQEGTAKLSDQTQVPLLGALPLDIHIRQQADAGVPIVLADSQSASAQAYTAIARSLSARLSLQATRHTQEQANIQ